MPARHHNNNSLNLFLNLYFNLFVLGAVILALGLGYLFFLQPKYASTVAAIKNNITEQEQLLANQQKKLVNLRALAEFYKKIDPADLNKFNGILPDKYVKERLFGELEEIVMANGFTVTSLNVNEGLGDTAGVADANASTTPLITRPNPLLGKIELRLSIGALDYAGFKKTVKVLENNLRLFNITALSFAPEAGRADFTLTTYYYNKTQ